MTTDHGHHAAAAVQACQDLGDALRGAGIVLPSLRVDPVAFADRDPNCQLLDLGRCNLPTARDLTAALTRGPNA
ncbi:hypothetical protein [Streptomyces sp. ODS28]|uniref:hypothetical protein n=1 Tax=Streptomyces sp. ODS28 TaxID=3136688 RepID=UPI0031EE3620